MVVERIRELAITAVQGARAIQKPDRVVMEEPLEIRVDGAPLAVVMRTPGHDVELAAGLLLAEELVKASGDLLTIAHCEDLAPDLAGNVVDVHLSASVDRRRAERSLLTSSSCGVCGKLTIESLHAAAPPFTTSRRIDPDLVRAMPERLRAVQDVFAATGGLHGAAIFDVNGAIIVAREDIGRHNAVDKCVGHLLLRDEIPLEWGGLVVSGRVSFEIVQKALIARLPLIVAVSAPSSLAIELATASNMALCGFVRGEGFNVYAGAL